MRALRVLFLIALSLTLGVAAGVKSYDLVVRLGGATVLAAAVDVLAAGGATVLVLLLLGDWALGRGDS